VHNKKRLENSILKLYILDNGWLEGDANYIVAMSVKGTLENKTPRIKWIKVPVYTVLIDYPEGKILFDTGCHPEAMTGYWPPGLKSIFPYYHNDNQLLLKQLKLTDTTPEEIKTVILSHMHLDHAGNTHLFRHAEIYVHRKDYVYGKSLINSSQDPNDHGAYVKADLEIPEDKLHFVDNDFEFTKNIEIITLPGHTPGILGLMVHLENDGTLIFPMDAVYTEKNYGPPVKMSGIVYDSISFVNSIEKVRNLQKKYNAKVMYSHDMPFFKTMKLTPQYYY
jgi:glyoxylase-like metal-dependent hydrolase (beta-lactamase superfamily II)